MSKELQKLMDDIAEWSDKEFGERQRTVPILYHLKKEVPEAIDACQNYLESDFYNGRAKLEIADCFMLILDAATHFNMSAEDLIFYTALKLDINKNRKWGKPDVNGVIEHIK